MRDDIGSLREEDSVIPECPDDLELQQTWSRLEDLIQDNNIYRAGAIKAGRTFGPAPVEQLIKQILADNEDRQDRNVGSTNVSAEFRQRVRKWKTTEKAEANKAMYDEHIKEVEQSYENGFRATREALWKTLCNGQDVDYESLQRTGRFLLSLEPADGVDPRVFEDLVANEACQVS